MKKIIILALLALSVAFSANADNNGTLKMLKTAQKLSIELVLNLIKVWIEQ